MNHSKHIKYRNGEEFVYDFDRYILNDDLHSDITQNIEAILEDITNAMEQNYSKHVWAKVQCTNFKSVRGRRPYTVKLFAVNKV